MSVQIALDISEITFDNAEGLRTRIDQQIAEAPSAETAGDSADIAIDMRSLERVNTLCVALMTAWYRSARLHNTSIVFVNLSDELRNIIAFSGLSDLLPEQA